MAPVFTDSSVQSLINFDNLSGAPQVTVDVSPLRAETDITSQIEEVKEAIQENLAGFIGTPLTRETKAEINSRITGTLSSLVNNMVELTRRDMANNRYMTCNDIVTSRQYLLPTTPTTLTRPAANSEATTNGLYNIQIYPPPTSTSATSPPGWVQIDYNPYVELRYEVPIDPLDPVVPINSQEVKEYLLMFPEAYLPEDWAKLLAEHILHSMKGTTPEAKIPEYILELIKKLSAEIKEPKPLEPTPPSLDILF